MDLLNWKIPYMDNTHSSWSSLILIVLFRSKDIHGAVHPIHMVEPYLIKWKICMPSVIIDLTLLIMLGFELHKSIVGFEVWQKLRAWEMIGKKNVWIVVLINAKEGEVQIGTKKTTLFSMRSACMQFCLNAALSECGVAEGFALEC